MELLKFQPFVSVLDPGFWGRFANDKLITYRLDDSSLPLTLSYSNALHPSIPPRLCGYAEYSFKVTHKYVTSSACPSYPWISTLLYSPSPSFVHSLGPLTVSSPSSLINFNTLDEFKVANKADLLHNEATRIWQDMLSLKALQVHHLILFATHIFHRSTPLSNLYILSISLRTHLYSRARCLSPTQT